MPSVLYEDFMVTVRQMRLATSLDTLTYAYKYSTYVKYCNAGIILHWKNGQVGVGAIATATAMAIRVNGLSLDYVGICPFVWEYRNRKRRNEYFKLNPAPLSKDKPQKRHRSKVKPQRGVSLTILPLLTIRQSRYSNHFNLTIKPGKEVAG